MKLEPCPLCSHEPLSRMNHAAFWQINCDNVHCKSDFEAEHKFEQIAAVRWNRYAKEFHEQLNN